MKKVIIAGAGISGATIARLFAEQNYRVEVYEKQNHIGGNCYDLKNKDGILFHRYGPHIFHTDKKPVMTFVKRFTKFNNYVHKVGVIVDSQMYQLPINFCQIKKILSPKNGGKLCRFLKSHYPDQKKISLLDLCKIKHFETLNQLTKWLFENIYAPYTAKMWGTPLEAIDPSVVERVKITLAESENYFLDTKLQGLPVDGYTRMIQNILEHKNISVKLNCDIFEHLEIKQEHLWWNNKKLENIVIYCGPIEACLNRKFGYLPYRSLRFVFKTYDESKVLPFAVVNDPSHHTKTRDTEYTQLTMQKINKTIISSEYPGAYNPNDPLYNVPYYPINKPENIEHYQQYKKALRNIKNFYLLGRLAEYKYYDMDAAINSAMNLFEQIHNNISK